jgi:hypothetical protein
MIYLDERVRDSHDKVAMALEALCGFDTHINFGSLKQELKCDSEVEYYSRNFSNNLELAVPPFADVSSYLH